MDPVVKDILEVSIEEFAAHGLAGARVDAIAARTATSKRMIYYHFETKEGLYAAALGFAYERIRSGAPPAPLDPLPPMDALRQWTTNVFNTHVAHPAFVRLVAGENLLGARFLSQVPDLRHFSQLDIQILERLVARGQADGCMRKDVRVLDVYANAVGLAFHFVSNRATFAFQFEADLDPRETLERRRASIVETIERQVMILPQ